MVPPSDDGRVVVELVEDDGGLGSATAPPSGGARTGVGARRRWGRRARWWGAVTLVALAAVGVVATVADRREEADRRARLAALPWVLPPLGAPLVETWRADALELVAVTSDVVVVRSGEGLSGLDPGSGAPVWNAELGREESCEWTGAGPFAPRDPGEREAVILCRSTDFGDDGVPALVLRSLDGRSGRVLDTVASPFGSVLTAPSPSDVVLLSLGLDGALAVERRDLRSGTTVWRHEERARPEDVLGGSLSARVTATTVVVGGQAPLVLDLATGAESADRDDRSPETRRPLAAGAAVVWALDPAHPGGFSRVEAEDSRELFSFEGVPVLPVWQDGRGAAFCARLWSGADGPGKLVALDARTGEQLWSSADSGAAQALLQLDGRLLRTSGDAVLLDVRSGRTIWRHPVDPAIHVASPVTDGDVVVLPVRTDGLELVAVSLDTGGERWRMAAPEGLHALGSTAASGLVLAVTDTAVVAYRAH